MINNVEIDLEDLALKVFTKLPSGPKSINVMFEDLGLKELFEALLTFLVTGLKLRYPSAENNEKVDLHLLTEEDLKTINEYMNSIGFSVKIDIYNIGEWILGVSSIFKDYTQIIVSNNTKLSELKCKFIIHDNIYVVSFDIIF
jgi:hypothetical protein